MWLDTYRPQFKRVHETMKKAWKHSNHVGKLTIAADYHRWLGELHRLQGWLGRCAVEGGFVNPMLMRPIKLKDKIAFYEPEPLNGPRFCEGCRKRHPSSDFVNPHTGELADWCRRCL